MFTNKVVLLSGDKREFNKLFIERFYSKVKEIRILTADIFDKSYDEAEKIKLVPAVSLERDSFEGVDYLYHFVDENIQEYSNFFSVKESRDIMAKNIIKTAITSNVGRVVFVSDGTTSLANDKMIKSLVVKNSTGLYSTQNKTTSINYVVAKGYESYHELIDFSLFATKTGSNGDVFVKKVEVSVSFSQRVKEIFAPKTKIQRDRESFLSASEMARAVDFGEYFKVSLDLDSIPTQEFSKRLESLRVDLREVEEV